MNLRSTTAGITLFLAGLAIGFGTQIAMTPTKPVPVAVVSSQPHPTTPSGHTNTPIPTGNVLASTLAVPNLEALVEEATALSRWDEKDMAERYNTYRRPIPDDWESIKAIALKEGVGEPESWQYFERVEAELERLVREESTNVGDLQLRREMVQEYKNSIIERLKNHLRIPLDEDAEYRTNQTGDFRYKRIIDAFLGPEMATLCANDETSCTPPIRVNFLCDMSQLLVCHQIARTIRASEDFFLMYPFDAKGTGTSLNWDVTLLYSDFGDQVGNTGGVHSLIVANSHNHDNQNYKQFILNRDVDKSYTTPEPLHPRGIIGSYGIDPERITPLLDQIKSGEK